MPPPAVWTEQLRHRYGERIALDGVDLEVGGGEVFGLLGPNGGGKTTLFRILTTVFPVQEGEARVLDLDLRADLFEIRARIGVVFQSPSLDGKLTVAENLRYHGRLYGMTGPEIRARAAEMLGRLGLADRANERVEKLSGGLARRVELAKGLLHRPELLILDEPSTGLDPGGRRDLWQYLETLNEDGVTVLVTTHLMEEAERCDRIGILDRGRLVAIGSPDELRAEIGGEVVTIQTAEPQRLARLLSEQLDTRAVVVEGQVRLEHTGGYALLARVAELAGDAAESVQIARPTLEDVFIRQTGHRFWTEEG